MGMTSAKSRRRSARPKLLETRGVVEVWAETNM
jgi:hypothetical protein